MVWANFVCAIGSALKTNCGQTQCKLDNEHDIVITSGSRCTTCISADKISTSVPSLRARSPRSGAVIIFSFVDRSPRVCWHGSLPFDPSWRSVNSRRLKLKLTLQRTRGDRSSPSRTFSSCVNNHRQKQPLNLFIYMSVTLYPVKAWVGSHVIVTRWVSQVFFEGSNFDLLPFSTFKNVS